MTRQEIREVLASAGLSLLFAPKDKQRDKQQDETPDRGNGSNQSGGDPARPPKARAAG